MPNIFIEYRAEEHLVFGEDCHYYLDVPVFYNIENYLNERVQFLFDTGAYITIINRATSALFEFDRLPSIIDEFPLTGFAGSCNASVKVIPWMAIGGRLLKGVKVAIPHEVTKHNILGMNVLDYFKYFIDSESNKIFFSDNTKYKMPNELRCFEVLNISNI